MAAQTESGIVHYSFYSDSSVKQLTSVDFTLGSKEIKIGIVWRNCMVILFYGENRESKTLMEIFLKTARQVIGINFGACNLQAESEVAKAFVEAGANSGPYHWARLKGYPFIMAYREGYPQAFYNGDLDVGPLADWSLTLACDASYFERVQLAAGVQTDIKAGMPSPAPYNPKLYESTQYRSTSPIRGSQQAPPKEEAPKSTAPKVVPPGQGPELVPPPSRPPPAARPVPKRTPPTRPNERAPVVTPQRTVPGPVELPSTRP